MFIQNDVVGKILGLLLLKQCIQNNFILGSADIWENQVGRIKYKI